MSEPGRKRILVTGGARGMGESIVRRAAQAGYEVTFTYSASADRAQALADELGPSVTAQACDFADPSAVEALIGTLESGGPLWGLIHNAGTSYDTLAVMADPAKTQRLMQVNFYSFMALVKGLARSMTHARAGRIVVVGSVTAERASQGNSVYAASKAALKGYVTTLSLELARRGVTVNYVAPGFVDTDMMAPYAAMRATMEKQIPAGRFGTPDDIAAAVMFLVSPEAGYITGSTLVIDGGLNASLNIQR